MHFKLHSLAVLLHRFKLSRNHLNDSLQDFTIKTRQGIVFYVFGICSKGCSCDRSWYSRNLSSEDQTFVVTVTSHYPLSWGGHSLRGRRLLTWKENDTLKIIFWNSPECFVYIVFSNSYDFWLALHWTPVFSPRTLRNRFPIAQMCDYDTA